MTGSVVSVVQSSGDVTVVLDQLGQTPGIRYWEADAAVVKSQPGGGTGELLALVKQLNAMNESERTVTFRNDAAVDVFIDGEQAASTKDLAPGMACAGEFVEAAEATLGAMMYPGLIRAFSAGN